MESAVSSGWVRVENAMPENLKVAPITDRAFRLWMHAICYCSRARTNGRVPVVLMTSLSASATKRTVDELLEAELVERLDAKTYLIHDYLDYNPSRARIDEMREATRDRVASWREGQRGNGVTDADVTDDVTALQGRYTHARDRSVSVSSSVVDSSFNDNGSGHGRRAPTKRVDQNEPPLALPDELHCIVHSVLDVLRSVQAERGGDVPTVRGVGLAILRLGNRDFMAVAHELERWALVGNGSSKPVKDWAKTYATFLTRTPEGSASVPSNVRPLRAPVANANRFLAAPEYNDGRTA